MPVEILKDDCTPEEAVKLIRMTPPNPTQISPATVNLADALQAAPSDPTFDLESWQCQWSEVEAELKSLARANDVAEGRLR
jgi:hypothetical protein